MNKNRQETCRIYVACLASYNEGTLHGAWIDIDGSSDEETILAEIDKKVISNSPSKNAEEFAIHDSEGFSEIAISESANLADLAEIAELIEEYGDIARAAMEMVSEPHDIKNFCENHCGPFENNTEIGEYFFDTMGIEIPDTVANYFDYESYGRDICFDYSVAEYNGAIYLFYN